MIERSLFEEKDIVNSSCKDDNYTNFMCRISIVEEFIIIILYYIILYNYYIIIIYFIILYFIKYALFKTIFVYTLILRLKYLKLVYTSCYLYRCIIFFFECDCNSFASLLIYFIITS